MRINAANPAIAYFAARNLFEQDDVKNIAAANRLELSDVRGGELILKYHWTEGLAGILAAKMVPVKMADHPIPFTRISNPLAAFTLQIGK